MKFSLIVAVSENLGIGIKGDLPWKLRNELKYFSNTTKRKSDPSKTNVLIMGRKTYFGIPENKRPIPERINIVLSRNPNLADYPKEVIVCKSLEESLKRIEQDDLKDKIENVWIVGGGSVYKEAMESKFCDKLFLTQVMGEFECDAFFPGIPDDFKQIEEDENVPKGIQEENGIKYEYKVFQKQH